MPWEGKVLLSADIVCLEVLALDSSIRFAGIANSKATAIHHKYRQDIKPLLTLEETEKSMVQAVIREGMRTTLEARLGECEYVFAKYKNVKRVTVPLRPPTIAEQGIRGILMISMELQSNHEFLIEDKVLPYLTKTRISL